MSTNKEKSGLFLFLIHLVAKPLIYIVYKPTIINKEFIPKSGPIILCGNHTNPRDVALLAICTKRMVHYLGKKELIDKWYGFFFKWMGIIPVDRKVKNEEAKQETIRQLNLNRLIGIFPEGTINRTRDIIMPFKPGAVSLAYKTNASIVPFAITGKYNRKGNLRIEFDRPFTVKDNNYEKQNKKLMEKVVYLLNK